MMNIQNQRLVEAHAILSSSYIRPKPSSLTYRSDSEKGVVLFMALIALMAMTFAALALVRSVDTTNLVAGNIAFKQGAIQEADAGMNEAFKCLDKAGTLINAALLSSNPSVICNYYPSMQVSTKKLGIPDLLENDTVPAVTTPMLAPNPDTGNTTRYIIERLCTTNGVWVSDKCLDSPWGTVAAGGWHDIRRDEYSGGGSGGQVDGPQAVYRISVKVSGPRNLKAYSQLVVNAPR